MASLWIYIFALSIPAILYLLLLLKKFIAWIFKIWKIQKVADKFLVEKRHWFFGHSHIIPEMNEFALKKMVEYANQADNGCFAYYIGFLPILQVCRPETVRVITKSSAPKGMIAATGSGYKFMTPWLGDGLVTSKGDKWHRNRRLLTPGFHFEILKPYIKIYNECFEELISKFNQICSDGQSVEVMAPMSLCTLDIIKRCAFSVNSGDADSTSTYSKLVNNLTTLLIKRFMNIFHYFDIVYKFTENGKLFQHACGLSHNYARNVIRRRRNEIENEHQTKMTKTGKHKDFLDILLLARDDEGRGLSDAEIVDEVETFMFAGHDTTSTAMSWLLFNLAKNQDIQKKAQQEVDTVMENQMDVEWDHLNQLPYVTRCIKESLRLHPPIPLTTRELVSPLEITAGIILPVGTVIDIGIYATHHNSKVWGEDHMTYDPDRFLPENMGDKDSHAFVPFSAGSRNCIGQVFAMNELKTAACKILKKFDIELDTSHDVELSPDLVLKAKNGIKLYFRERN